MCAVFNTVLNTSSCAQFPFSILRPAYSFPSPMSAQFIKVPLTESGPGSSVGTATGYRLDGPGIESRWDTRFSAPVQTSPGVYPAFCTMGTGSFPGGKERPGRGADPLNSFSGAVVKKEYEGVSKSSQTGPTD